MHPFERGDIQQPVEDQFLDLIGAPQDPAYVRPPLQNERLNRDCIAYLATMQEKRRLGQKFARIKQILSDYSRLNPDPTEYRYEWTPQQRRAIVARYADQNARVATDYLHRPDGVLFSNPLPKATDPWAVYTGLKVETAVHIGEYLATRLYEEAHPNAAEPDSEAGSAQA